MAQSRQLVQTLKRALRTAQITYADIARHLDMSEANVKRLFATHSFTLQRIESICELMHMDLADLFNLLESERQRIQRLITVGGDTAKLFPEDIFKGHACPVSLECEGVLDRTAVKGLTHRQT